MDSNFNDDDNANTHPTRDIEKNRKKPGKIKRNEKPVTHDAGDKREYDLDRLVGQTVKNKKESSIFWRQIHVKARHCRSTRRHPPAVYFRILDPDRTSTTSHDNAREKMRTAEHEGCGQNWNANKYSPTRIDKDSIRGHNLPRSRAGKLKPATPKNDFLPSVRPRMSTGTTTNLRIMTHSNSKWYLTAQPHLNLVFRRASYIFSPKGLPSSFGRNPRKGEVVSATVSRTLDSRQRIVTKTRSGRGFKFIMFRHRKSIAFKTEFI